MKPVLWVFYLLLIGCACDNHLSLNAVSQAPPTKEASLQNGEGVTISKDVALALECWVAMEPCAQMNFQVKDPATVQIFKAFENQTMISQQEDQMPVIEKASVFVVVGTAVGTTTVHIDTKLGNADLAVKVVEP